MMVLGLGDIVFCLFGWGGGGSKLESPGAGIFFFVFFFFFFTGEADSHGSFICLPTADSIYQSTGEREYFQR